MRRHRTRSIILAGWVAVNAIAADSAVAQEPVPSRSAESSASSDPSGTAVMPWSYDRWSAPWVRILGGPGMLSSSSSASLMALECESADLERDRLARGRLRASEGEKERIMNDVNSLDERLASLLADAANRRAEERAQREREMQEFEPRRVRFERTACALMSDLVVPRLRSLSLALRQTSDVQIVGGGCSAYLKFDRSDEYPVAASLTVSITPGAWYMRASIHIQPKFSPMLAGYPPASHSEFELDASAVEAVVPFVDDQLMLFAASYLKSSERASPYQQGSLVTDPVCGMTFQRTAAAESHEYEGTRHYFCAASCAEQFRHSPDLYLLLRQGAPGGVT